MTLASEAARVGRQPAIVLEMDCDTCSRVYGTAPCTAAIGVTGTQRCFNTKKTCQDPANFDKAVQLFRFSDRPLTLTGGS
jgi:hypothetical protein